MKLSIKIIIVLISVFVMKNDIQALSNNQIAIFAGGCFWCMEKPFQELDGVHSVVSGYIGGNSKNPSYEEVCSGTSGHLEAIEISFNEDKVSYNELLDVFWRQIDPTDDGGQFVDRGDQYTTAIFFTNNNQETIAEASKKELQNSGRFSKEIVTLITKASKFYIAEEYHQDFYKTNPGRYNSYHSASGRDRVLGKIWKDNFPLKKIDLEFTNYKKPSTEKLKKLLSKKQYNVSQECGTEQPFNNEYWDNKQEGIYVDIVSGEPLFSSKSKFKSGTGWPSFHEPIEKNNIVEIKDFTIGMSRIEVRSKNADSHLGHLFNDGPGYEGTRYCINSASLRFIAKDSLLKEGYKEFLDLFNSSSNLNLWNSLTNSFDEFSEDFMDDRNQPKIQKRKIIK